MAGFNIPNQVFGVCDAISQGLLSNPVSGLLGLAWQQIASSGATPLWQTLAGSGQWDQPLMAFQLTRWVVSISSLGCFTDTGCRFLDDGQANSLEPGGSFTMGFVNTSLYTGNIDFQPIPSGQEGYWILPITAITVQGNGVTIPSGSSSFAAIDTGTTLVGGPSDAIAAMFAEIPGSAPGTGNYDGYYTYPCNTNVTVALTFGGQSWSLDPDDFKMAEIDQGVCVGAFFSLNTGSGSPNWIVGDTFLVRFFLLAGFHCSPRGKSSRKTCTRCSVSIRRRWASLLCPTSRHPKTVRTGQYLARLSVRPRLRFQPVD
jgi:cathepsin D